MNESLTFRWITKTAKKLGCSRQWFAKSFVNFLLNRYPGCTLEEILMFADWSWELDEWKEMQLSAKD